MKYKISKQAYIDIQRYLSYVEEVSKSSTIIKKKYKYVHDNIKEVVKCGKSLAYCINKSVVKVYGNFVIRYNFKHLAIIFRVNQGKIHIIDKASEIYHRAIV